MMGSLWFVIIVGMLSFAAGVWLRPKIMTLLMKG